MDYSREEREIIKELLKVLGESGSLDDALMTFYNLHSVNIRELFEYYTDDEMALELARLFEKLLSGIKPDEQFVEEIKKSVEKGNLRGRCTW